MYTFFYTQVKDPIPALHSISNIPIAYGKSRLLSVDSKLNVFIDLHISLNTMADSLTTPQLLPLQPHVRYVLSRLQKDRVFLILPKSDLGPMNPRELPRELYADDGIVFSDPTQKRKGRPAKRDKGKKARLALEELDDWLSSPGSSKQTNDELGEYRAAKTSLMQASVPSLGDVGQAVLGRLREEGGGDAVGVQRVEQAIAEGSVLGLLR